MEYIEKINKDTPKLNYTAGQGPLTSFYRTFYSTTTGWKIFRSVCEISCLFWSQNKFSKIKKKQLEILSHKISGHSEMKLKVNTMETLKSYTHTTRLNSTVEWAVSLWEIGKNI